MDSVIINTLSQIDSPSMMDILKFYGLRFAYNSYDNNAHRSNLPVDHTELNNFCKMLYKDLWNNLCDFKSEPLGKTKEIANQLRQSEYDPQKVNDKNGLFMLQKMTQEVFHKFNFRGVIELQDGFDDSNDPNIMYFSFLHVCPIVTMKNVGQEKIDVRLYLNLKSENRIKFSEEFYKRIKHKQLSGYFKFSRWDNRNDTWLVYSSYENLNQYIDIIESIKKDKPELLDGTEKVSPNMGVIKGYIGFGEDPKKERESYNSKLSKVTNNIFKEVFEKTMQEIDAFVPNYDTPLADNQDIHLNNKLTFKKYIHAGIDPIIEATVNDYVKNSDKPHNKESLLNNCHKDFERNFAEYLISGELKDIEAYGTPTIQVSKYNWTKYLKPYIDNAILPNQGIDTTNDVVMRAVLSKYAFFRQADNSHAKQTLFDAMKHQILIWLESELQKETVPPTIKLLAKEFYTANGQPSQTGNSLVHLAIASFIKSKGYEINITFANTKFDLKYEINRYQICEAILGKDRITNIAKAECDKNDVDFHRVCFNASTVTQHKIPNYSINTQDLGQQQI